ncbi:phosphoribosyl-ATP diphosphatase [Clostridium gasigenes]|uniref:phosphoribosyl-ATP diphosphatase n=1 Tax=Clostridium gasigenes TaxID=94869 RepID=UPI0014382A94|nr:phosphoribosyl-ATP diphosphatase [Clostridium gasigenes]MBB6622760.1 phosphoribosyl-ATP diphosphatase [Clostridium gasigenes]MBU3132947.1 phosphoribosyl-ATP diphosphatase [Clostridium gasigenes]MBU3136703.1 phosphoribosyl-ATP diphosphatase [Clostridium gasigenes]NKF06247.1 phosphoribosyl-ATP diphosphatase [Clostridium gasigenes]QSW20135.1 phosphoribosyl-ATP diphosphatase [Clostridium gasigenes]
MENIMKDLYEVILGRKNSKEEGSYTSYLFAKGIDKILKKIGEESTEVIISAKGTDKEEQINEICDLSYHLLVMMAELGISVDEVEAQLIKRKEKINNFKGERKEIEKV